MRSVSPCCLSSIESGRKQHYPLGGTVWNVNEKVDYCTTCLKEVEDPVLVYECCGTEICECEEECKVCGGSGFSGYGTGYDAVCDECGGRRS